jgi:enterobactin synthetase component D / holo-[acyl-carrier protein] synthase
VIERLVPDSVTVVSTRADLAAELFAEEERSVGRAVETRRQEFTTGRACARLALRRLGIASASIPSGERGEPLWPPGVVGSITHCRGYRACAVARAGDVLAVGVDAEVHEPLPDGVLDQVAFGREIAMVADRGAGVHLDKLLFSAKEAVYKAWFPLAGRWLGFEDVELTIDANAAAFCARLLVPGPVVDGTRLTELRGRWRVEDGLVATAAVVLPDSTRRLAA